MLDNNTARIVASFSTIKSMIDAKEYKSPYMILAEFIQYIIVEKKLYSFTSSDIKKLLVELFGFELPEAVIKSSIKKIEFIERDSGVYKTDTSKIMIDDNFKKIKNNSENEFVEIFEQLKLYIEERNSDKKIEIDLLTNEFISFLIDDNNGSNVGKYIGLISEFILKNEENSNVQKTLTAIREGSIIYIGLNYNINDVGNVNKPLTLYLATEVLFNLYGLNGEIHKQLAQDFFSQVRDINIKSNQIKLRYFLDVKKEIEDFFSTAILIIDGKRNLNTEAVAMRNILNGCDTASDINVKKADFFTKLKSRYGILLDEKTDYYEKSEYQYNLEEVSDPSQEINMKLISNINKLRKGEIFENNLDAQYLIVTNSSNMIKASKQQVDSLKIDNKCDYICDFALSVDKITNILWYQLGKLFGKNEFPKNVNTALKARTLLSSHIAQNVCKLYSETNKKYSDGEISSEQLIARIAAIHKKPLLPEDLNADTIEDIMDFSPENIMKYEEEVAKNKEELQQYKEKLKKIEEINKIKEIERNEVESELERYKDKERRDKEKKIFRKKCIFYILKIAFVFIIGTIIICGYSNFFKRSVITTLVDIITVFSGIYSCYHIFKKDFKKNFGNKTNNNE
ncbi:hypothetical protein FNCP11_02700 [Fusobacterium nucleatum]|uniref:hypothetical protein n=1 Tax=Fusobacterium nucleatum subsp. polymorphum TaxID=76857 RepID=UPI002922229F|nr:hypothetical protein FNCP11_02700 [Fusobacterium nucleatum]BEP09346.1 hypothetical protein FNSP11_01900 [Fusobacterium nucleatum]